MGETKPCRKRKTKLKKGKRKMSYQEFIDGINGVLKQRKEMEDLFSRVLILNSESVLAEMEIKRKNNEILQAHILAKSKKNNAASGTEGADIAEVAGCVDGADAAKVTETLDK